MKKRIKIQGFLIFLSVACLAVFYQYLLPEKTSGVIAAAAEIFGMAVFLLGYFLRTAARGYKAELNPDGKTLATQGVYALTRNPMYLGTLFIGLGIILLILRWWVALVFVLVYLLIYIPQIRKEEKKLTDLFGGSFRDYCNATPKFFPSIKSMMRKDSRIKFKLSWIKKELPSFSAAFIFVMIVKTWELLR
ncbi:MAG: isoprenylcysteine carboxylmethyltransferase family protein [Candidatus Omnitrophica bacterium]|nr:isoprenylcysteine carboxylmethyltransferase family protein [Candidatus Omnitrophota bacterium]